MANTWLSSKSTNLDFHGSHSASVQVWNLKTGQMVIPLTDITGEKFRCDFSDDGQLFAVHALATKPCHCHPERILVAPSPPRLPQGP